MKPILVHCHIFYPELWAELKSCIMNIAPYKFDLFATMIDEHKNIIQDIKNTFPDAHVSIVNNVGYDIAPFISVINQVNLDNYSYVVKLHTKRAIVQPPYLRDLKNDEWKKTLLSFVRSKEDFNHCIEALETNPKIGMINDYKVIVGKDFYDKKAYQGLNGFIKEKGLPFVKYRYVAGTMFVARVNIFYEVQNLHLSDKDFPVPDKVHSMQLAHFMERFMGYIVYLHGMIVTDIKKTESFVKDYLFYLAFAHYMMPIKRIFYQKKITKSGEKVIQILRIPVFRERL